MANWSKNGGGLWSDAGNWDGPVPVNVPDDAVFTASGTAGPAYYDINLGGGNFTVENLIIASNASHGFSFSNGTLTMGQSSLPYIEVNSSGADAIVSGFTANLKLASDTVFNFVGGATFFLNGDIQGSGAMYINFGTLQIGHANVSRTGSTYVWTSVLDLMAVNAIGGGALNLDYGPSVVDMHGNSQSVGSLSGTAGGVIRGTEGAVLTVNQTLDQFYDGVLSGGLSLTKMGAAVLTLSQAGEFNGATVVGAGTLSLTDGYALVDSSSVTVDTGAVLELNAGAGTTYEFSSLAGDGTVTVAHTGAATLVLDHGAYFSGALSDGAGVLSLQTGDGVTYMDTDNNTYSGGTTINSGTVVIGAGGNSGSIGTGTVTVNSSGTFGLFKSGDFAFANAVAGAGRFEKNLAGTVTLTGDNSGFTGTLNVNSGTLKAGSGSAFGAASSVNIAAGAVIDASTFRTTLNNLSGEGTLTSSSDTFFNLTLNNSSNTTFAGTITGGYRLDMFKSGAGTLTLTGADNAFNNRITGGTLALAGNVSLGRSDAYFSVSSGAAFDISGLTSANLTIGYLNLAGGQVMLGGHQLTISEMDSTLNGSFVGVAGVDGLTMNLSSVFEFTPFDLSGATFSQWNDAVDRITINGGGGNEIITGSSHADRINGGGGTDTMTGGAGDDTYVVDSADDTVTELTTGGSDTVESSISYTLGANVEKLILTGAGTTGTGNGLANLLTSSGTADTLIGGQGDDTYVVNNAGDVVTELNSQGTDTVLASVSYSIAATYVEKLILTGSGNINAAGNGLANVLTGNDGNNRLDGSVGADTMIGGQGNDTYVVDNANDIVTELLNQGTDTVLAGVSYTLSANVDNLTLTGFGTTGTGNDLGNVLTSSMSVDTLAGGKGDDTYVVNDGTDVVTELANGGTDTVLTSTNYNLGANIENLTLTGTGLTGVGNGLNNLLTSSVTADTLVGGAGDDTYVINNTGDLITEGLHGGTDTVMSSVSYSIAAIYVENITLTGSLFLSATGNGMNNILTGNSGNNIMNGNVGADTMIGGAGSDYYYVDNAGDVVTENTGEGTDMVYALISYALGANVENVTLLGTGNLDATGNELNNFLFGTSGNNSLNAGAGADYIFALGGNDLLDGGAGADGMYGGSGNDTYYVDNFADLCNEQSTGTGIDDGGVDIVISSANFQLSGFIENLTLTGTAVVGAGNASNNTILGNASGNYLFGLDGADTLNGGAGGDALYGGAGADTFVFSTGSGFDVIGDFKAAEGDSIDLHAYSNGVVNGAEIVITASGSSTYVNMGNGNVIFVANASVSDVSSHIVW